MDAETALVEKAFLYARNKRYPENCTKNEKRCIRRKAERLVAKEGVLYYKKKDGDEVHS